MTNNQPRHREKAAIIYDFDGTLAPGNVPEHSLLPALERQPEEFWATVKARARLHDGDEILTYMHCLLEAAQERDVAITREVLREHGRGIRLFEGLDNWFDRINAFGSTLNLSIEHYIISSGLRELIEGCAISDRFRHIFACAYAYGHDGRAAWPAVAINYTNKTQFLFRINKGIMNTYDNESINRWMPHDDRPIPFKKMLFLGDGDTDIPSMKMVRYQGGQAIAVFDPKKWDEKASQGKLATLIQEDRVDYVAPADFRDGSMVDVIVRGLLGRMQQRAERPIPRR